MSPEVRALAEAFTLAFHEAVRLELMEEMRAFAAGRQKREPRRAPRKKRRQQKKRRAAKRSGLPMGGVFEATSLEVRRALAAYAQRTRFVTPILVTPIPKMEDLDTSRLLAAARTEKAPRFWPPPPRLSKDGHTRGCRRVSTGKCSPNCAPSIEAAKQERFGAALERCELLGKGVDDDEDVGDDEGAGVVNPRPSHNRVDSTTQAGAAPAPGESFTTKDIRAAVEDLKKYNTVVHGPDCGKPPDGECSPACYVPVPIDPGSVLADVTAEEVAGPGPKPAPKPRRYPPEEIAAKGYRIVVVRIDGKAPHLALLTSSPKPGFHDVQLSQGSNFRFAGKRHRIIDSELVRDATDREAARGYAV